MTTFDPGVPNPLQELAARVARLEEFQTRVDAALHRAGIYKMVSEPPARIEPLSVAVSAAPSIAPPVAPPVTPPIAPGPRPIPEREVAAARLSLLPKAAPKNRKSVEEVDAFSIERLIGGRWLAAAGAVIVVIGVGLFLKLAYDLGWFGGLSPAGKCGMGALFGAALMAAGESVRRRVNALGSVGLFAAGLGTMYASAYAAHATYGLVGPTGTMALLVGCVALGIVIGSLTDLVAVAVLSLLGGYITPFMLHKSDAAPWFLPVYLLALLAVALVLSGWKCVRLPWFSLLRTVAWWGTLLLGGFWTLGRGDEHWIIGLFFLSTVWSATHFERFFSAGRMDRAAPPQAKLRIGAASFADARLLAGSLSTTAWCALLAIVMLDTSHIAPSWYSPAALCAATFSLAFLFAGHRRVFTEVPRTSLEKLGIGMVIQSGALLIAAIALAFTGWVQVVAGLSLGVAAVAVGRWMNSRALDYYGMAVLTLASGMLGLIITTELAHVADHSLPRVIWGLAATEWSWRILLTAAAWFISAVLMLIRNPAPAPARAIVSAAAGVVGLMLAFVHPRTDAESLCIYWGAIGLVMGFAPAIISRLRLAEMTLVVLSLACVAWIVAFPAQGWNDTNAAIACHLGLFAALGLAGAWLLAAWRLTQRMTDSEAKRQLLAAAWSIFGLLVFVSTSFEIARAASELTQDSAVQRSAVSIYWGFFAVALLVIGFLAQSAKTRYVGLALINIAALKAVIIDLSGAPPAWRIASFIGLGLLMIVTAVGYAKLAAKIGRKEPESAEGDRPPVEAGSPQ